jgi:uncharacterized protein (TIGR02246 family)
MKNILGLCSLLLLASVLYAQDDARSQGEVKARFDAFNEAWKERDLSFIRDYYAHDPEMLLFFERRQLRGWERVETLYENMFAHALPGSVKSTYSNVDVGARGDMAYVAANFHLQVTNPQGEESTDSGRVTVVFERREDRWIVVHRHTSFQAPPGPQRRVELHTEPGPLWSPTLEGAWRGDKGEMLIVTASFLSSRGVSGFPETATYRIAEEGIWVTPEGGASPRPQLVELERLNASELMLRLANGVQSFRRVE